MYTAARWKHQEQVYKYGADSAKANTQLWLNAKKNEIKTPMDQKGWSKAEGEFFTTKPASASPSSSYVPKPTTPPSPKPTPSPQPSFGAVTKFKTPLGSMEESAVKGYTDGEYSEINNYLRKGVTRLTQKLL